MHAAVDTIGLPIRIHPTPGQWGDRPQAEALLAGLEGVGHVIADAAYDADPLRAFIADSLGATAHIKANPSRTTKPSIDWRCLIPAFDGASSAQAWKDALWDRFYTGAPARQRQSVERYSIVKRA